MLTKRSALFSYCIHIVAIFVKDSILYEILNKSIYVVKCIYLISYTCPLWQLYQPSNVGGINLEKELKSSVI